MKYNEKEYGKRYYLKHRDRLLKRYKNYYQENREKLLEKSKNRYKQKKEIIKSYGREYRKQHNKKYSDYYKKYYRKNKKEIIKKRRNYEIKNPERIKSLYPASKIEIPKNQLCQICKENSAKIRHHFNYSRPSKVNFLCKSCHKIIHHKNVY